MLTSLIDIRPYRRYIASASRTRYWFRAGMTRLKHFPHNLPHRDPDAPAYVVDIRHAFTQRGHGPQMSINHVLYMHVVSHGRPIRGRIIDAKDLAGLTGKYRLGQPRKKSLTASVCEQRRVTPRDIKIPQRYPSHADAIADLSYCHLGCQL